MALFDSFTSLFGRQTQEPRVASVSVSSGLSFTYSTDFEVFYKAYEQNSYVEICVNKICRDVGKYKGILKRGEVDSTIDPLTPLLAYSFEMTQSEFIRRLVRDFTITGNAYVFVARNEGGKVMGLQVLDPRYMKPIVTSNGMVKGYVQNFEGMRYFTKDEVYHLRNDGDLSNPAIGRSRIQSLFLDLESDREAKESNWAFFVNNQTPSSIIIMDDTYTLTDTSALDKIKNLMEGGANRGGKNKHRTSFISGVKEIVKIQDKIDDAQFLELRRFTLELVCSAFGVPKDVLGFTETSNRSVGENQTDNYWDMIEGLEEVVAEFLTKIIQDVIGAEYSLYFPQDNLRKLQKKGELANDLYAGGIITKNEAREIIQYETVPNGDEFAKNTKSDTKGEKSV